MKKDLKEGVKENISRARRNSEKLEEEGERETKGFCGGR